MREELKDLAQDATKRAQDYCAQVKKDLEAAEKEA